MVYKIIALSIPVGMLCLVVYSALRIYGFNGGPSRSNKITFKDFIKFYGINPHRWDLYDDYVVYKKDSYIRIYFKFRLPSWIKYKLWVRDEEKREIHATQTKDMVEFLKSVNADIDELIKESNANAAKAMRDIYDISKRI